MEKALIEHMRMFLLELGGDFAFVGSQRRIRIGAEWYKVDLVFFHRGLRCLILIDLKLGAFKHEDVGQMHMYVNYAKEHWARPTENAPVGLILSARKNEALARYALTGLEDRILAATYRTVLPDEGRLAEELEAARRKIETRRLSLKEAAAATPASTRSSPSSGTRAASRVADRLSDKPRRSRRAAR